MQLSLTPASNLSRNLELTSSKLKLLSSKLSDPPLLHCDHAAALIPIVGNVGAKHKRGKQEGEEEQQHSRFWGDLRVTVMEQPPIH